MQKIELTPEMERAYSSLLEYATEVTVAYRDNTGRANEMAHQLFTFVIPRFKSAVPLDIRYSLSYGSHQSLEQIERTARELEVEYVAPQIVTRQLGARA